MRRIVGMLLIGVVALGMGGCAKRSAQPAASSPAASTGTPPPASSPLAKVKVGMGEQEVRDILGPPTSENEYVTGKAFVPYYFGPDRSRRGYFYKGVGRVVFSGGSGFNRTGKVSRVEYDPNEPGAAR
jgi:hypothetical protein